MDNTNIDNTQNIVNNFSQQEEILENQNFPETTNNIQEISSNSNLQEELFSQPDLEIENTMNLNIVNQESEEGDINENVIPSIPLVSANITNPLINGNNLNLAQNNISDRENLPNLQHDENSQLNAENIHQIRQNIDNSNFISRENQNNTINLNYPLNPPINNIPNILNSHINTIEEIQRATNEEILNLFRQAINIRERGNNNNNNQNNLRSELQELEENIFEHLISNKVFLFSPFILILLISCLGLEINTMIKSTNFSFKTLETEVMWVPYCLTLLIIVLLLWNFYLLFFKIFAGFSERSLMRIKIKYLFELGIADVLYFNPFYFNMIIFHFDKTYLSTNFDLFANMSIATHYMINFLFANLIFNFFKFKIANITNLHLPENKYLIHKMRFLFSFLIFMNMFTSYTITYITTEADFYYIYLMQHKCFYLILKEFGMWYENETAYKQLDNYYATNEQYYLNSIFIKMIIQLIVMVLIVQILFFGNMLFCKRGAYIFFVPCLFICIRTIYEFFKIFRNYEDIKLFFDKLDSV
jgi:hypothetical protein